MPDVRRKASRSGHTSPLIGVPTTIRILGFQTGTDVKKYLWSIKNYPRREIGNIVTRRKGEIVNND